MVKKFKTYGMLDKLNASADEVFYNMAYTIYTLNYFANGESISNPNIVINNEKLKEYYDCYRPRMVEQLNSPFDGDNFAALSLEIAEYIGSKVTTQIDRIIDTDSDVWGIYMRRKAHGKDISIDEATGWFGNYKLANINSSKGQTMLFDYSNNPSIFKPYLHTVAPSPRPR